MDQLDDLATYNGDTDHDMWVDYTYDQNTGELDDLYRQEEENELDDVD